MTRARLQDQSTGKWYSVEVGTATDISSEQKRVLLDDAIRHGRLAKNQYPIEISRNITPTGQKPISTALKSAPITALDAASEYLKKATPAGVFMGSSPDYKDMTASQQLGDTLALLPVGPSEAVGGAGALTALLGVVGRSKNLINTTRNITNSTKLYSEISRGIGDVMNGVGNKFGKLVDVLTALKPAAKIDMAGADEVLKSARLIDPQIDNWINSIPKFSDAMSGKPITAKDGQDIARRISNTIKEGGSGVQSAKSAIFRWFRGQQLAAHPELAVARKTYADYAKMYDQLGSKIDEVGIQGAIANNFGSDINEANVIKLLANKPELWKLIKQVKKSVAFRNTLSNVGGASSLKSALTGSLGGIGAFFGKTPGLRPGTRELIKEGKNMTAELDAVISQLQSKLDAGVDVTHNVSDPKKAAAFKDALRQLRGD